MHRRRRLQRYKRIPPKDESCSGNYGGNSELATTVRWPTVLSRYYVRNYTAREQRITRSYHVGNRSGLPLSSRRFRESSTACSSPSPRRRSRAPGSRASPPTRCPTRSSGENVGHNTIPPCATNFLSSCAKNNYDRHSPMRGGLQLSVAILRASAA